MKKIMIAVISLLLVLMMVSCEEEIKSYTVNFDLNGGGSIPSVTVLRGKSIQSPEDPSMEGMKFCGWYLNDNLYDFNLPITTNITLVAKWEHVEHIFNLLLNARRVALRSLGQFPDPWVVCYK